MSGGAETAKQPAGEEEHQGREHKSEPSSAVSVFQPGNPEEPLRASKHALHHHHPVDIDVDTPVDAVRAPGCFNRLKEEVEAVVETIAEKMHLKKPTPRASSS